MLHKIHFDVKDNARSDDTAVSTVIKIKCKIAEMEFIMLYSQTCVAGKQQL